MNQKVDRPAIPDVIDRFVAYFQLPENGAWGSLHCVLDDGNVSDDDVRGAIEFAVERGDHEGEELGRTLLRMSRTQRLKLPGAVTIILRDRGNDVGVEDPDEPNPSPGR